MNNYKYEARIEKANSEFYAIVVCIDNKTGFERVVYGYNKFFKTLEGAKKSTNKFINKILNNKE